MDLTITHPKALPDNLKAFREWQLTITRRAQERQDEVDRKTIHPVRKKPEYNSRL